MRGRLWLKYFTDIINSIWQKHENKWTEDPSWHEIDAKWTEFMRDVMDGVADKMNCKVDGEYLCTDVFFFDSAEYDLVKKNYKHPFVLPRVVVELENNDNPSKIVDCLWKILCIRSPIRVLICYQHGEDKITSLRRDLQDVIWEGNLMKGTDGDLLVIIGDADLGTEIPWNNYFKVFEWRNDKLKEIEGLEWR